MGMHQAELFGKVVVVTGASMGIGEAIAKIFADAGANVVLLARDAERTEAARTRIGHQERTLALACDVRNREEIDRVVGLDRCTISSASIVGSTTPATAYWIQLRTWIWPPAARLLKPISSARSKPCRL